jgi:hypothetical protein
MDQILVSAGAIELRYVFMIGRTVLVANRRPADVYKVRALTANRVFSNIHLKVRGLIKA